jgi:hypothetical protein
VTANAPRVINDFGPLHLAGLRLFEHAGSL